MSAEVPEAEDIVVLEKAIQAGISEIMSEFGKNLEIGATRDGALSAQWFAGIWMNIQAELTDLRLRQRGIQHMLISAVGSDGVEAAATQVTETAKDVASAIRKSKIAKATSGLVLPK